MRKALIGTALALALATPAFGFEVSPEYTGGADLQADCKSYSALPPNVAPTTFQQGRCLGVLVSTLWLSVGRLWASALAPLNAASAAVSARAQDRIMGVLLRGL
jgi:hypothetical protein